MDSSRFSFMSFRGDINAASLGANWVIQVTGVVRMGSKQAKFEEDTMKEFEDLTPLNRAEIYHAFEKFHELYIEFRPTSNEELPAPVRTATGYINPDFALPINVIADKLPQLKANPFRYRICEIFATSGTDMMSFVEFLDMVSAFSPKNTLQQKTFHAFQIFDMDQNGLISREDLYEVMDMITDTQLSDEQKAKIVDEIFSEVHKEENADGLNTEDFRYAISRSPDFSITFGFRI